VEQHDSWRKLYLHDYHKADWDDPLLYHLTINTGRTGIEEAVDLIVRYAAQNSYRKTWSPDRDGQVLFLVETVQAPFVPQADRAWGCRFNSV
ncbi:MAG: hypothetical protein QGI09_12105, partial [Dehalococcoidia bacterium]|nr:hypothetical protein [Dehalococcoidia bacterium]